MVLPDHNLLVYAYNADAPLHDQARKWWEESINSGAGLALSWIVCHGFIRIMTHLRIMVTPLVPQRAVQHVQAWLALPELQIIEPGSKHIGILDRLLAEVGVGGNLCTDAVIASLAIEYQCELHSNDTDFARFSGLRWKNPLSSKVSFLNDPAKGRGVS